jgi:hypothetical protein
MSADTETSRTRDTAAYAVFAGLVATAVSSFSIQAWMTYGFAEHVISAPSPLRVALVVTLDVFAVLFMILTYLLRGTGGPRAVVTVLFFVAIGAQAYVAELYGAHQGWPAEVRVVAVIPAIFLAGAQEGVIMWRTHRHDRRLRDAAEAAERARAARQADLAARQASRRGQPGAAPVTDRPPRPLRAPASPPVSSGRRSRPGSTVDERKASAVRRVLDGGEPAAVVARDIGEAPRNVQNWANVERARRAAMQEMTSRDVTDGTADAPAIASGAIAASDAPVPIGSQDR